MMNLAVFCADVGSIKQKKFGWAGGELSKRRPGLSGITNDQEIHDIIKLYKNPLGIATPVDWKY